MENLKFPALGLPKVRIGDKTEEILLESHTGSYDVFLQGLLATADNDDFYQAVKSCLFAKMPLPSILVKNVIPMAAMVLVLTQRHDLGRLMPVLSYFITQSGLPLQVIVWHPQKTNALELTASQDSNSAFCSQVEKRLESAHCPYTAIKAVKGSAALLAEEIGRAGLAASVIGRKNLMGSRACLALLARMESPVMMFWQ